MNLNMIRNREIIENLDKVIIYNDKSLTTKLFEFSGIEFEIFKEKEQQLGISFNLNKMENMQQAENYFSKITNKEKSNTYKVYYTSIPECDILHNKDTAHPQGFISIGITDTEKKTTYIAINFQSPNESEIKGYTKTINDGCISYKAKFKKAYVNFNQLSKKYFSEKKQRGALNEMANKFEQINTENSKKLQGLNTEKKTFTDKLEDDKKELEKLKKEGAEKKNILIKYYSESTNLKEEKVKNDDLLVILNKKLEDGQISTNKLKEEFDITNKEKNLKKIQLDQNEETIKNTKNDILNLENDSKKKDELINKFERDLNKINSDIQTTEKKIAENKNKINKEQSILDENKGKNISGKSVDNKKNLENLNEAIKKIKLDIEDIDKKIKKNNNDIERIKKILNDILNDPEQKINSRKDLAIKLEIDIKEYLDNMKKIYPLIPEIYFENIWKMIKVNHSEALNYISGIRPSIFSLYDNLYSKKHPEIRINDVDFKKTKAKKIGK